MPQMLAKPVSSAERARLDRRKWAEVMRLFNRLAIDGEVPLAAPRAVRVSSRPRPKPKSAGRARGATPVSPPARPNTAGRPRARDRADALTTGLPVMSAAAPGERWWNNTAAIMSSTR